MAVYLLVLCGADGKYRKRSGKEGAGFLPYGRAFAVLLSDSALGGVAFGERNYAAVYVVF